MDSLGARAVATPSCRATTYTFDPLDRTTSSTSGGKTTDYTYLGLSSEVLTEEVAGELSKSYQYSPWGERLSPVSHQADAEAGVEAGETAYYGYNAPLIASLRPGRLTPGPLLDRQVWKARDESTHIFFTRSDPRLKIAIVASLESFHHKRLHKKEFASHHSHHNQITTIVNVHYRSSPLNLEVAKEVAIPSTRRESGSAINRARISDDDNTVVPVVARPVLSNTTLTVENYSLDHLCKIAPGANPWKLAELNNMLLKCVPTGKP
ncbi:hypothetical protein [Isoptericola sp. NPDC055881]